MKNKIISLTVALVFLSFGQLSYAADTNDISAELKTLIDQIRTKLQAGDKTEAALAPEIKQFDAILAEHKNEKTDAVAQVAFMKATLYLEVFDNEAKGVELIKQIKIDYPDTKIAQNTDKVLNSIAAQDEAKKLQAAFVTGAALPDFDEKDTAGNPLSIASRKGKIVLVDFWATWCPPCRAEIPNVVATYNKYHAKGFDIIGVSLDEDRAKLDSYTKDQGMTWSQFFDGQRWQNKLAVKYGVQSIPATFLLDGEGKIIARDLRGDDLEAAVAKALKL